MNIWDIIMESIRENLLLFRDAERYRSTVAVRTVRAVVLVIVASAVVELARGNLKFDIGFVVGIFAIFISWLFFSSSERNSHTQMQQLHSFLSDFRKEAAGGFDKLGQQLKDAERGIFSRPGDTPPPPPSDASDESASSLYARTISDMMKSGPKQMIIALHESKHEIPHSIYVLEYGYELHGQVQMSTTVTQSLTKELAELGMVSFNQKTGAAALTERGDAFAKWLSENDQKAEYFECPMLGIKWGEQTERFKHFFEQINRSRGAQDGRQSAE